MKSEITLPRLSVVGAILSLVLLQGCSTTSEERSLPDNAPAAPMRVSAVAATGERVRDPFLGEVPQSHLDMAWEVVQENQLVWFVDSDLFKMNEGRRTETLKSAAKDLYLAFADEDGVLTVYFDRLRAFGGAEHMTQRTKSAALARWLWRVGRWVEKGK